MALLSWSLVATSVFATRDARATTCTLPAGCTTVAPVCHLGVCTPCVANYDDGGINDVVAACQDPSKPICETSGALGGQCVAADAGSDAGGGDAGAKDSGSSDGSATDGGASDGATSDGSASDGSATDGSATDGASEDGGSDGSTPNDAAGGDGAASDGSTPAPGADGSPLPIDATVDGSAGALDGAFVEGGGCSCSEVGGGASMGGALFAMLATLSVIARRRRR